MRAAPRPGAWEPVHSSVDSEARQWQLKRELEQAAQQYILNEKSKMVEDGAPPALHSDCQSGLRKVGKVTWAPRVWLAEVTWARRV